jgi:hypothetical protein
MTVLARAYARRVRGMAGRDTFYARLILPEIARAEIVQSFFDGGS